MRRNQIVLLVIFLLISELAFGIIVVADDDNDGLETTDKEKAVGDTYVSSSSSNTNYGNREYLYAGLMGSTKYMAYFYFDFDDQPDDYNDADFYFAVVGVSKDTELSIFLVDSEDFDEDEITWNDSPSHEDLLDEVKIDGDDEAWYKVDLDEIIDDEDLEEIALVVNLTHYTDDTYVIIDSIDGSNEPFIGWTYQAIDPMLIVVGIIILIVIIVAVVAIIIILLRRRKRKKGETDQRAIAPPPTPVEPAKYPPRKQLAQPVLGQQAVFCHHCGASIVSADDTYCQMCGQKVNE